jgi:hypothetical protein
VLPVFTRRIAALSHHCNPYRYWMAAAIALACWFAHPLLVARVPPIHDLPNHLARITALHYLSDARWNLQPYYARSLQLVPYLGHFLTVHLLAYVFRSVVVANLVFMVAYVMITPWCGLAFARATGRSPWLALLLLPISVNQFFQWGFLSFCVGVMLMLPALATLYRVLDSPSARSAIALGLWCAALYLFHIVPWAALGIYAGVLLLVELAARRTRGPLFAAAAMLPSVGLMAIGLRQARSFGYFASGGYESVRDAPDKLLSRITGLIDLWKADHLDEWVALALLMAVALLVCTDAGEPAGEPWRRRVRVPLAFLVFLVLAAVTPFWIKRPFNWWMINVRFVMPAACVALFLPRGPIRGRRAWLLGAAIAVMLLLPGRMARHYLNFSRRAVPVIKLIQATPLGSNTLMLHAPPPRSFDDATVAPGMATWRELYNYPLVYRGGFDPYMYDDGFPIKRIRALPAPKVERAAEQVRSPGETQFDPQTMMQDWDYFIVPIEYLNAMPPDGVKSIATSGRWTLFQNLLAHSPTPLEP